jgi:hypothetical protein
MLIGDTAGANTYPYINVSAGLLPRIRASCACAAYGRRGAALASASASGSDDLPLAAPSGSTITPLAG